MSSSPNQTARELHRASGERRGGERRREVLRALVLGSFYARRRRPRRTGEQALAGVDWHHPQWLATALLIVLFSSADALLTVELMGRGAYEVNPLMRPLIASGLTFVLVKVGVTAGGVIVLTLLARMRAFGRLSGGLLLYAILATYGALLLYELNLLDRLLYTAG